MKNESICLSIIIPCYNVENYIKDCLNAVTKDDAYSTEIICIDDGSTDNTLLILEQYQAKFDNVRIIKQPNLGVSKARNKGFECSSGNYILFIDSDDMINPDLLKKFRNSLNLISELDLFYFDYTSFKDGEIAFNPMNNNKSLSFNTGLDLLNFLLERRNYSGVIWRFIFNRKLFSEKFIEKNHEDHSVSLSIISKAKSAYYFLNKNSYFHRVRTSSLSEQYIDDLNLKTLKKVLNHCITKINSLQLSDKAKCNYVFVMNITYLESLLKSNKTFEKRTKDEIIKEIGLLKLMIRVNNSNKSNAIRNIFYIFKFIKKNPCSLSTKKILLKCAITKKYPYLDTKKDYKQYSSLNKF
ncbi:MULTISPECIES: glycosyltransferase family 2 protein [unclassified Gilliamella]|uniref:glycosyltransferase family 2 protein n=1 Tax=unclassified Gilliamella TaxID=2685620 RepID=UPI00226A7E78|nr:MULTISPECIES: glycosyltransferase family 2 protein [unclassified Gilliamella]MCX8583369.1 glycosyltransferase [Gilliamella sp. B3372]MCX8593786.1 glycosyltransferase [Gilliamella sp. B3367]